MPKAPRLLAFSGSLRRASWNRRILDHAVRGAADAGAEVTLLELRALPLPLFDQDLEDAGTPDNARAFKDAMRAHDGFLIACPEHNSSITAALKNALDWASRPAPDEPPLVAFRGKVAGLCAASPGALGGLRGLVHVRAILGNLGVHVVPDQVAVPNVSKAFADDGTLTDAHARDRLAALGRATAALGARLIA